MPDHWQASPNRIRDDWNYDGNVEIVALEFNTQAHWTRQKLCDLPSMQARQLTQDELTTRMNALLPSSRKTHEKPRNNAAQQWQCLTCGTWCMSVEMLKGQRTICKKCHSEQCRRTIRAELQSLFRHAKHKSKQRNEKLAKSRHETPLLDFDIDLSHLLELLQKQQFRCAYSGVPLQFPCLGSCEPLFRMSLERENPCIGYVRGNVCLIAAGFQSTDHTRTRRIPIEGSAAWSKVKVNYVLRWLEERNRGMHRPALSYTEFQQLEAFTSKKQKV